MKDLKKPWRFVIETICGEIKLNVLVGDDSTSDSLCLIILTMLAIMTVMFQNAKKLLEFSHFKMAKARIQVEPNGL